VSLPYYSAGSFFEVRFLLETPSPLQERYSHVGNLRHIALFASFAPIVAHLM